MNKGEIRKRILGQRDLLPDDVRARASESICQAIADEPWFLDAGAIHTYMPIGTEVDVMPLIELAWGLGKDVGMMIVDGTGGHTQEQVTPETKFTTGPHGIRQPIDADEFDMESCTLVIVPIVAGDGECNRIGYGKGYYDQFLSQYPRPTIGVAFDAQIIPNVPVEDGDIQLDIIMTESGRYSME